MLLFFVYLQRLSPMVIMGMFFTGGIDPSPTQSFTRFTASLAGTPGHGLGKGDVVVMLVCTSLDIET
jgi:hypothetical protein